MIAYETPNSAMLLAVKGICPTRECGRQQCLPLRELHKEVTLAGLPPCVPDSQGHAMSEGREMRKTQDRMMTLRSQDRDMDNDSKQVHRRLVQEGKQAVQRSWGSESGVIKQQRGNWCDWEQPKDSQSRCWTLWAQGRI